MKSKTSFAILLTPNICRKISVLLFSFFLNPFFSKALNITGKVIDAFNGTPVNVAYIQVFNGQLQVTKYPKGVSLDGTFVIDIGNYSESHLTIKIWAKNYVTTTKTMVIVKQEINMGDISLIPLPSMGLGSIIQNKSSDSSKTIFDIYLTNVSNENIIINKLSLSGVKRELTECLDPSPNLVIQIGDKISPTEAIITTNENRDNFKDKILIEGNLEILPCNQMRLKYTIPYSFAVKTKEDFKLRVTIPCKIKYSGTYRVVDLTKWDRINIEVLLDNGQIVQTKRLIKN